MKRFVVVSAALFVAFALSATPITLTVDATHVASNVYHAHLTMSATPGPMTLYYPKWIPGEHGPTGPINGLTGLQIKANGTAVPWLRDPVDMFAFQVDVPAGATSLDIDLDYLAPAPGANFTAGASTSPRLAVLSWNTVLLYPKTAAHSDSLEVDATLRIPAGWQYATTLETRGRSGDEITFESASLTRVIDSPVQLGTILRQPLLAETHAESALRKHRGNADPRRLRRAVRPSGRRGIGCLRRESLSSLRLAPDTERRRGALRPRTSRVERRSNGRAGAAGRDQP